MRHHSFVCSIVMSLLIVVPTLVRAQSATTGTIAGAVKDASGADQSFDRGPGVIVAVRDPLAAHRTLLDRYTDTNMHDLTTYLWTLK